MGVPSLYGLTGNGTLNTNKLITLFNFHDKTAFIDNNDLHVLNYLKIQICIYKYRKIEIKKSVHN